LIAKEKNNPLRQWIKITTFCMLYQNLLLCTIIKSKPFL